MVMYKLFLFDFDLTLADGSQWIVDCYQQVLQRHGFYGVSREEAKRTIGLTVENSFQVMTGITDPAALHALREEYREVCRPQMAAHTFLFDDARRFLLSVRQAGVQLGIVSTKQSLVIRQSLQRWELEPLFSLVFGLNEVGEPKPSPMGLLRAMAQLQVEPQQTLYFGDSTVDAQAAQRAGVGYVGVAKGMHTVAELAAYPHVAVAESYDRLSGLLSGLGQ